MRVIVLGSTGSVGQQALGYLKSQQHSFTVVGLAARGSKLEVFQNQAEEYPLAKLALINSVNASSKLKKRLSTGPDSILELIEGTQADIIINAIDGFAGLIPTLAALKTDARLALANKESLIFGGAMVMELAKTNQIIPVDSEHSAIFQCLKSGKHTDVKELLLTASGGPFLGYKQVELAQVTPKQAVSHPVWSMGRNISLNSATLVNKGLEIIEAFYLFRLPYDQINVVIHPQAIVHSMVTFRDGATFAQLSNPSMVLPIAVALNWPSRVAKTLPTLDFSQKISLEFQPVDEINFPAIKLAKFAGKKGGSYPAIFNSANEQASAAFFSGKIKFTDIVSTIAEVLEKSDEWSNTPTSLSEILTVDKWARSYADSVIARKTK